MKGHVPEKELSAWLDRELGPGDAARVEKHLGTCDACRQAAREMAEVGRVFRAAGGLELPPFLWARIAAALDRKEAGAVEARRAPRLFPLPLRLRFVATAAACLALTAGGLLLVRVGTEFRYQKRTLSEIERARISVTASLREESYNPFFRPIAADREANPFSPDKLEPGFNPFRSAPGTR